MREHFWLSSLLFLLLGPSLVSIRLEYHVEASRDVPAARDRLISIS